MKPSSLKVIFAGTPEFAAAHLKALIESNHQVCGVYTQPDRPAGRGRSITASSVKQLALENNLPVLQPQSLKTTEAEELLSAFNADIMVVVAYGIILPRAILDIPALGCINVHGSLLPRWRGAAPIQRAIEAGDKETGITIMQMDEGLDTGDMLLVSKLTLNADETSESLHDRLIDCGTRALIQALDTIAQGKAEPEKQDNSKANYAKKLSKAESSIDWSQDARTIDKKIRAFTPWPGCFVSINGKKMKIMAQPWSEESFDQALDNSKMGKIISADKQGLRVACGKGSLLITSLQMPGKKMTAMASLLNAYKDLFLPGQQFDL
ncbi:MAG: methionyl-tRNA formyltransferase [Gammaproteobacteria bacterium]|nr:methionyl-tRNA formyltransferase [Gammaproteobacteria bacterium]